MNTKTLSLALCGLSGFLLLAACEPTYRSPPTYTSPTATSPSAQYAAPAQTNTAVVPAAPGCVYTSRSYASGSTISPPELPGTTLQCVNGRWQSL
jgi:hypothetical protein